MSHDANIASLQRQIARIESNQIPGSSLSAQRDWQQVIQNIRDEITLLQHRIIEHALNGG